MTLDGIEKILLQSGIEEGKTEAYILCEHFTSLPKSSLVFMRNRDFDSPELCRAVERRTHREPLAYIIGKAYFMNEEYEMTPDCLIPRPETEILCETAAKALPQNGHFLDLCTGSGCIAISMLALRRDCTADAVEISSGACETARRNAERNLAEPNRLRVECGDIFRWQGERRYDVITANPPYVAESEMDSLHAELFYEPRTALTDGGDGLSFVREIVSRYTRYLLPKGELFCEIGYLQGEDALSIARQHGFGEKSRIIRDFSGLDRILHIKL